MYKYVSKNEDSKSIDKFGHRYKVCRVKEQKELPKQQEHFYRHSFDIKSSKAFTYAVIMTVVCFASLVGNYLLW